MTLTSRRSVERVSVPLQDAGGRSVPGERHVGADGTHAPGAPQEKPRPGRWARRWVRRSAPTTSGWYVPAAALGIVSALILGLCLQVVLLGHVSYTRAQQIALAQFRSDLARATAPVGQTFTPQPEIQELAIAGEETAVPEPLVPLLHPLGTPVAVISIETVGMGDTVVLEGTTSAVTQGGPGHERNSVLPGQEGWSLLYGRAWSYGAPFAGIDALSRGDEIRVTTGQGEHTYEVSGVRRPGEPLPRRDPGQGRLVLATADGAVPFVPQGVVYVDAVLTSEVQPTPPRRILALEPGEAILAGDPSAWLPILLWAQGLTLAVLAMAWARTWWGRSQAWMVGVPLIAALGIGTAHTAARLLPNVL